MDERKTRTAHLHLHRRKLAVFGSSLVVIGVNWTVYDATDATESAFTHVIELDLPTEPIPAGPENGEEHALPPSDWETATVKRGQTLDAIFRNHGFDVGLLHRILAMNQDTRGLRRIRPGETFEFQRDPAGELSVMRYPIDDERYLLVHRAGDSLTAGTVQRQITREIQETGGIIDSSLFVAGKEAGLSDQMVMKLANIFGWDIDFVLEVREGDRFLLVYEKVYRDGEFLKDGDILAATFINHGKRFRAIRHLEGDTAEYFAPDGRPMRKAFLRAPLNFSYISSGFNPRRMHPVLKRIRPHNGIDYYAPRGTPVYAAGDGAVSRSGYSAGNGHHVFIKHANSIETKYLHFTKRLVKVGQRVKQGQTIGTVGSTGLATGPHLHYEFVVNGVHRNPRTVPLPNVEPLAATRLAAFQRMAAPLLTQLSRMESASLYASRE